MDRASSDFIFNSFASATKEDWRKAAQLELEGADPFQKLAFEKGNLAFLPYYDQQDRLGVPHFQLPASSNEFLGPRAWYNMPSLAVANVSEANKQALSQLNAGADGVFFKLNTRASNCEALLEKIIWPYCALNFEGNIHEQFLASIHAHALEKKYEVATLTGCAFGDHPFESDFNTLRLFESWKNFHPLGISVEKKESPAEEIAVALAQAVRQIDVLTDKGFSAKNALQFHAFSILIEEDFFLTIVKLKTLRYLWHQVASCFDKSESAPLFIHATSLVWNKKEYMPNANMLKATTAALSAVLGGCDALTVLAEDNDDTKTRIARNVSSVLREESHLARVADPTAGSYYIESLINQLAHSAWEKFQAMM